MPDKPGARVASIDALRGSVMILMALDHVRDFFHAGAMSFSPTDLTRTTPILFLTRWVTHFCLPAFMFTAGVGAFFWWKQRNHTKPELARFLVTRGVWFIALELTVMQLAYDFNVSARFPLLLLILWIFGICFIVMAALIWLPEAWLLAVSLAVIALHNLLDRIPAARFGSWAPLWDMLHQPAAFTLAGRLVVVPYTLLPWIGVVGAGFCFGRVLQRDAAQRRQFSRRLGIILIAAFLILRLINHYGDPAPWSAQKDATFTVLSFLNCTKYPASLDFLLMTLGPAFLAIAFLDRIAFARTNPLIVFGRVPFFFFVLHFYLIHALAVIMALARYGRPALGFIFNPLPSMAGPAKLFPANFGYSLPVVYAMWIFVVVVLYPLCRWYAGVKTARRDWWLGYL